MEKLQIWGINGLTKSPDLPHQLQSLAKKKNKEEALQQLRLTI